MRLFFVCETFVFMRLFSISKVFVFGGPRSLLGGAGRLGYVVVDGHGLLPTKPKTTTPASNVSTILICKLNDEKITF
jgi:hypothetical protein